MNLKSYFSKKRSGIQFSYYSKLNTVKGNILLNSMPKSGTHFFKALLQGMGYRFCGHISADNSYNISLIRHGKNFFTAHTRKDIDGGIKFLTIRDPLSMTLSQAYYIKKRSDHYRHNLYKELNLEQSMLAILEGSKDIKPLLNRYFSMFDWAKRNNARILDFDDFKMAPQLMQKVLNVPNFDKNKVNHQLDGWTPTKRVGNREVEADFLNEFNFKYQNILKDYYAVYESMLKQRPYDI